MVLGWAALLAVVVAAATVIERQWLLEELQTEASILHRLASQRADQHDAHLTSLSGLAVAGRDERQDLFLDVAATILRFYPRIESVDLVPLNDSAGSMTTRTDRSETAIALIRDAARASKGQLVLRPAPDAPGRYLVVKRSPNTDDARYGLSLQIDANALLTSDSAFWTRRSISRMLALPDGTVLVSDGPSGEGQFAKVLGSASQPLVFRAGIAPGLSDLLSPTRFFVIAVVTTFLYLIAILGLRQFARARRAENEARLSAQDARLAHASRVNVLGEMASGMAHELTQPLTAILSQAQAGRHIATRSNVDELVPVFEGIAGQAKRASAILDRLRNWTRPQPETVGPASVNDAIRGVELLLRPEAKRSGIDFSIDLEARPMWVRADQVELEQVIFNLVRNAMDAVADSTERQVAISTFRDATGIVIEIADTGPGVTADIRQRLFEPFVSGRPGGTGLGLALCKRLVDRMDGDLVLADNRPGTVFRLSLPQAGYTLNEAAK